MRAILLTSFFVSAWLLEANWKDAKAQTLGFEHCWFTTAPPPQQSLGQQLAVADRIEALVEPYETFPYEQCYNLGRSCVSIAPELSNKPSENAHLRCQGLYPIARSQDYDVWLAERTAYNTCMAEDLRRQADDIRAAVLSPDPADAPLGALLDRDTTQQPVALDRTAALSATSDVTWCAAGVARIYVAILCNGGGLVASGPQGQTRLEYRVNGDGALCLWDFETPETCHTVELKDAKISLVPEHAHLAGSFTLHAGVARGTWQGSCPAG